MIGKNQDPEIGKETQFKPGESGNPAGKPKGTIDYAKRVRARLEEALNPLTPIKNIKELIDKYGDSPAADAVIFALLAKAITGDIPAAKELREAGFGNKLKVAFDNDLFVEKTITIKVVNNEDSDPSVGELGPDPDAQPEAGTGEGTPEPVSDNDIDLPKEQQEE